uniref:Uncharacterized protein n=1 Tax=Bacillus sp. BS-02 TaxID=887059 RepID=E2JA17_9BACI|nr:site-specific DNA-methyltransferase [Bacillus sp. BS-02]ADN44272.1 hypothetical protein [Bacillus sp. BS-02]
MSDNKVETELLSQIKEVLLKFPKYWEKDVLLRNKVAEDLRNYNQELIEALLSNQLVKDTYSISLNSTNIFKIEEFISMLRYKNYWENSYTKYSNEIGLTSEGKYLNYNTDVVLDFPHKDSVLEGGMTKEDQGKKEIYYHNVLAKEEIDTLLSPKVLTNIKKYDKNGKHDIDDFTDQDNLIIKGNNLIALHSLKERYENKIKMIYIDPPYNTGNDSFKYNDKFNHSTWLAFVKNRLEIAYSLLSQDGSIYIQIDNNEVHYLKVLMDEIFGENNFQREIIWVLKGVSGYKSMINNFVRGHETILFYSKSSEFSFNKQYLPYSEAQLKRFTKKDKDGRTYKPITKTRRMYLDEAKGIPISDVWDDIASFQTVVNAQERVGFNTQKPEKLIQRIIDSSSNKGDIILDFFMGSSTTQAVAHKMGRQYIGIEQMDYINTVSVPRLQKVIEGEQGGISKDVDWKGGGSFVYAELASLNERYVKDIQQASNEAELEKVLSTMKESAYLNFKVDLERVSSKDEGYHARSLEEKKEVLIQVLDMNQLYLSYSEIEDEQYKIPEDVKAFNHSFYQKEGVQDE